MSEARPRYAGVLAWLCHMGAGDEIMHCLDFGVVDVTVSGGVGFAVGGIVIAAEDVAVCGGFDAYIGDDSGAVVVMVVVMLHVLLC